MKPPAHQVESILAAAVELASDAERREFLDRACAGDAELKRLVEGLIENHFRAGSFLESPAREVAATAEEWIREGPGTVIGPYKLLEQLGEGGFGVVFLAEQTQPVRRKVALKVLKAGMDTRQVVARFEAERQALAIMDHPHIAKVFDGGATASGRPYFVMELVKGVPITAFCDQNCLTPRQRLELFIPVCQAVQHAHQKGIIHRDLKPSNVLVSRHDTTPVVKVIDFGVAKALGQELTDKTLYTGVAQMIGTPLYMSPEQAGMSDLDVDTRSDIYSLGVLLYELLTGTTPFTWERFQNAGYDEIRRIIREEEPPRPSTRLSGSAGSLPSVAALRHTEPAKLTRLVRGELDWIVMKALEKDRNRRYDTANSLALDLQRYLADEPVEACPPSAMYRLRKFARRHKGPMLTGLALAALLVLGTVCTSVGLVWALEAEHTATLAAEAEARQRRFAETQRKLATQRLHQVTREKERATSAETKAVESEGDTRAFSQFLVSDVLAVARPKGERGGLGVSVTVKEALDAAVAKIGERFRGRPRAEAFARHDLGVTYRLIGELDKSLEQLRLAYELRKKTLGADDERTVHTGNSLAVVYQDQGRFAEAEPLLIKALEVSRRVVGEEHPHTLSMMNNLAAVYRFQCQPTRAEPLFLKALEVSRRTRGEQHPDTLAFMTNLAGVYTDQGRFAEAERLCVEALAGRRRVEGEEHPGTLRTMYNLAEVYLWQRLFAKAEPLLVKTLEVRRRVLGEGHPHTLLTMNSLGRLYQDQGQFAKAEPLFVEALAGYRRARGDRHPDTLHPMNNLAVLYWSMKRLDRSVPLFEEALKAHQARSGPDSPETLRTMANLGLNYRDAGRLQEATASLEQVWERIRKRPGLLPVIRARLPVVLVETYERAGQFARAEPIYRAALEKTREQHGASPATAAALVQLGSNLLRQKKYADAEPLLREYLTILGKNRSEGLATFNCKSMLGGALLGQNKYADAEPLLLAGYEGLKRREADIPPQRRVRLTEALERLVELYTAWGEADKADTWRKRLDAHRKKEPGVPAPPGDR
jgi:serine/threonine protein kinase/tetratricopeptide (TPR) repeat protein